MVMSSEAQDLREPWHLMTANCIFIDAKTKNKKAQPVSAPRLSLTTP
jgi:hypothetical protein